MPVDTYSNSYEDIAPQWQKCRDAYQGQEALRQNGAEYVPPLDTQTVVEYNAYLKRGLYFNVTSSTVHGMLGSFFRR